MAKCSFVVPLHPRHFEYGVNIYNHLREKKSVDVYFVFTSESEKDQFLSRANSQEVKYLVLTDFTDLRVVEQTKSYVSIKKLYALQVLKDKYDYISCIDAEVEFISNVDDYYDVMQRVVNSKTICGTMRGYPNIIRDSLTRLIDAKHHESLRYISHNYTLYTWWCNLPVYDCSISGEFLEWIDFRNTNLDRFCWNIFDDIVYNFFCLYVKGYQLKDVHGPCHLEFADSSLVEHVDKTITKLYWVNNKAYQQNREYYINNGFRIAFHLDR